MRAGACLPESPPTARRLPLMPLYRDCGSVHHRQRPPDSESDEAGVDVRGQCAGPGMLMLVSTTAPTSLAPTRPGLRLAWTDSCPNLPGPGTWTQALVGPASTVLGSAKERTRL